MSDTICEERRKRCRWTKRMMARSRSVTVTEATVGQRLKRGRRRDSINPEYQRDRNGEAVRICALGQFFGVRRTASKITRKYASRAGIRDRNQISSAESCPRLNPAMPTLSRHCHTELVAQDSTIQQKKANLASRPSKLAPM